MNQLIKISIEYYRTVLMVLFLIIIGGIYAYVTIPKEKTPDVKVPYIYVAMTHEGISPDDAERLLIRPMEVELRSIEGIKEMTAYASEGRASVTLEFQAGFDSDKALNDVREKVDTAKTKLPQETDEPEVHEINLGLFPVINIILEGDISEYALISIAKNLKDKIEEISTVLSVDIGGDREESVEIIVDPAVVENYKISFEELNAIATGFNKLVAAGAIDNGKGRYTIKVPGLLENLDDIMEVPVKKSGDAIIKVRDIATIKKTFKDPQSFARVNGKPAVTLEVSKRSGTNIIETINNVKKVIEAEKDLFPKGVIVKYSQDNSEKIKDMLSDLENSIILTILLVMIVVVYFVGFRSATLITISIPGSFLMGVLILYLMGMTMNIVVLFSLILSVGMLVDSAIIVCEMADRKMTENTPRAKAYTEAAVYMAWPIITSTATTLVVFMPLLFWPGLVGQFMQYLPITLIAVLSSSLVMAIIFVPTLGAIMNFKEKPNLETYKMIELTESGDLEKLKGFTGLYYHLLKHVVEHAGKFLIAILSILFFVYFYYASFGTGVEFFPNIEPENSQIVIRSAGNMSVNEKDDLVKDIEKKLTGFDKEVKIFYTRAGNIGQTNNKGLPEDTIGTIQIEYADWKERRTASEITSSIRQKLKDIGGVVIDVQDEQAGPGGTKPIEIQVSSRMPELINPVVDKLMKKLTSTEGVIDVENNLPVPSIEWEMELNREMAARFNSTVATIGNFIRMVTNGLKVTSYRPNDSDDEVDILVRFPEDKRNLSTLDALKVITPSGAIPVSNFVERQAKKSVGIINRANGQRAILIKAGVADGYLANDKVNEIKKWLIETDFDSKVNVRFKGDDEQQKETGSFLSKAFVLALFSMALILVAQFNSIYYMLIILSAVFLSTVGVLLGLLITNQPFGIVMCGVGIIALAGIVVNNNIIFIDTYLKIKSDGASTKEAIFRTGVQRLRPILLTAGTTVLGLIPMVFSMSINFITREVTFGSPSSQWWTQLSISIAGGLSFATILTLFFTPCLLILGEKISLKKLFKSK